MEQFDALPELHQVLVACAVREAQLEAPEIHSTLDVRNEARASWVPTLLGEFLKLLKVAGQACRY